MHKRKTFALCTLEERNTKPHERYTAIVVAVRRLVFVKMVRGKPLSEYLRKSTICAHHDEI